MAPRAICLMLLLICMPVSASFAAEIHEVVTTSPSWNTFTNRDGTGLYHEVIGMVFDLYGVKVRHEYSKSSRSEEMVFTRDADIMTCDDTAIPGLVLGRYPLYENNYFVFYKKSHIGQWRGIETLWDKEVLSQPTFYSKENFSVPVKIKEVMSGSQALDMILLGRSDFYVDDMLLIQQSMEESDIPFRKEDYGIEKVGSRAYFPIFNQTPRGKRIREMFEQGIMKLHKAGKLKPVYEKWGHKYPEFVNY